MDIHQNARTTPLSRAALVRRVNAGELPKTVAAGVGVCDKTVRKWAGRFSREGVAGAGGPSSGSPPTAPPDGASIGRPGDRVAPPAPPDEVYRRTTRAQHRHRKPPA